MKTKKTVWIAGVIMSLTIPAFAQSDAPEPLPSNPVYEPMLTFGFVIGTSLSVSYGDQQVDGIAVDHTHTELKPAIGFLMAYRKHLVAYELNCLFYRQELSFTLQGDPNAPQRYYGNSLDGINIRLPMRISKLTYDRSGLPTNKVYAGVAIDCLLKDRTTSYSRFRPDLAEAIVNSIRTIRPQLNVGFEKFLGSLGLQLDAGFSLWPSNKKIILPGLRLRSRRKMLNFSLVAVYRFYKKTKEEDLWY